MKKTGEETGIRAHILRGQVIRAISDSCQTLPREANTFAVCKGIEVTGGIQPAVGLSIVRQ